MIVEMVTAQVRERACAHAHAIEPKLIEPMRGGFEREMRHTLACEPVERCVQCHRIRRGQRSIDLAFGRDDPDGADARCRMAEHAPDLSRECRDRGLAARSGDGDDGRRLAWKDFRGRAGKGKPRIRYLDERCIRRKSGRSAFRDRRRRPLAQGLRDDH